MLLDFDGSNMGPLPPGSRVLRAKIALTRLVIAKFELKPQEEVSLFPTYQVQPLAANRQTHTMPRSGPLKGPGLACQASPLRFSDCRFAPSVLSEAATDWEQSSSRSRKRILAVGGFEC